jgi:3-deoxy-D-manno-octulosonic-acid transferase
MLAEYQKTDVFFLSEVVWRHTLRVGETLKVLTILHSISDRLNMAGQQ